MHAPPTSEGSNAERIPFDRAPQAIMTRLAELRSRTLIVGVTGPTGSGKSTLAHRLVDQADLGADAGGALVLSTDRYLPDYGTIPANEVDEPRHARLDRLVSDLSVLHEGRAASVPVWSFHTHRPEGEETVGPAGLIVLEGIFALQEAVIGSLDLRVLIEAPTDVRWNRVEARELSGARGWGVERSREHFQNVADPIFERFEDAYRSAADVIVLND